MAKNQPMLFPIPEDKEADARRRAEEQRITAAQETVRRLFTNPVVTREDYLRLAANHSGEYEQLVVDTLRDIFEDPNYDPKKVLAPSRLEIAVCEKMRIKNMEKTSSFNLLAYLKRKKRGEKSRVGEMTLYEVGKDWSKHSKLDTQLYPTERYVQAQALGLKPGDPVQVYQIIWPKGNDEPSLEMDERFNQKLPTSVHREWMGNYRFVRYEGGHAIVHGPIGSPLEGDSRWNITDVRPDPNSGQTS